MSNDTRYYVACAVSLIISGVAILGAQSWREAAPQYPSGLTAAAQLPEEAAAHAAMCAQAPADRMAADNIAKACMEVGLEKTFSTDQRRDALNRNRSLAEEFNLSPFQGREEEALLQLLELDPANTTAKLLLAQYYRMTNRFDSAVQIANALLEQEPANGLARLIRGLAANAMDRSFVQAEDILKAVELLPDRREPLMALAQIAAYELNDLDTALEYYSKALKLGDGGSSMYEIAVYGMWPDPVAAVAGILLKQPDTRNSIKLLSALLDDTPDFKPAKTTLLAARADLFEQADQPADAILDIDALIKLTPPGKHPDLLMRRGFLKMRTGQHAEAQTDIERSVIDADLSTVLKLQVRLRNAGQVGVKVTGKFDLATQAALTNCLKDLACGTQLRVPI